MTFISNRGLKRMWQATALSVVAVASAGAGAHSLHEHSKKHDPSPIGEFIAKATVAAAEASTVPARNTDLVDRERGIDTIKITDMYQRTPSRHASGALDKAASDPYLPGCLGLLAGIAFATGAYVVAHEGVRHERNKRDMFGDKRLVLGIF